jgi:hypothetical protein
MTGYLDLAKLSEDWWNVVSRLFAIRFKLWDILLCHSEYGPSAPAGTSECSQRVFCNRICGRSFLLRRCLFPS